MLREDASHIPFDFLAVGGEYGLSRCFLFCFCFMVHLFTEGLQSVPFSLKLLSKSQLMITKNQTSIIKNNKPLEKLLSHWTTVLTSTQYTIKGYCDASKHQYSVTCALHQCTSVTQLALKGLKDCHNQLTRATAFIHWKLASAWICVSCTWYQNKRIGDLD